MHHDYSTNMQCFAMPTSVSPIYWRNWEQHRRDANQRSFDYNVKGKYDIVFTTSQTRNNSDL